MANKLDALNAYSAARARVETWKDKFLKDWNQPMAEALAISTWNRLSKPAQELFKRQKPDEYKKLMEIIARVKGEEANG